MPADVLEIVYDGDCPVCAAWMRMTRLRETVGRVEMVDARSDDPRVAALLREGYDLDRGMVVRWRGRTHHGAEAVSLLALLSDGPPLWLWFQRAAFSRPRVARIVYPVLVRGRLMLLRLMGRKPIRLGKEDSGARE